MTASSPVTLDDLINGLILNSDNNEEWRVIKNSITNECYLSYNSDDMNQVTISSDGLTISFSSGIDEGPTFTGFTFNA